MYNAMIVQISHRGQHGAGKVCRVGLVVTPLATDTVEELAAQGKIGDQIHWNKAYR